MHQGNMVSFVLAFLHFVGCEKMFSITYFALQITIDQWSEIICIDREKNTYCPQNCRPNASVR